MTEGREVYKEELEDREDYYEEEELEEVSSSDEFTPTEAEGEADFEKRVRKRKAKVARRKARRKLLLVVLIIALFASLATMCGRDIIRLKAENRALKKRLREEVKNAGDRDYVQDQARKQLRLLNPGELLFTFEEEEEKK